jgi:hypothetical protein
MIYIYTERVALFFTRFRIINIFYYNNNEITEISVSQLTTEPAHRGRPNSHPTRAQLLADRYPDVSNTWLSTSMADIKNESLWNRYGTSSTLVIHQNLSPR